jgi:hypothetical protein
MYDPALRTPDDDPQQLHLSLSAQRALLGSVGPAVRAVTVGYMANMIVFAAYVDQEISDAEREDLDDAATEVIADYPEGWGLEVTIREELPALPGYPQLVYLRRGERVTFRNAE